MAVSISSVAKMDSSSGRNGPNTLSATAIKNDGTTEAITLNLPPLTDDEREILLEGCLMNYYAAHAGK